jgi:chemotaxis protein CheZ
MCRQKGPVCNEDVSLSDVVALAEITATSLQTFFENMDVAIYRELREIAEYIQAMKIEIGALGVNEIRDRRIPAAGEELGAIIKATENATNTIMGCAEAVMSAAADDVEAFKALVEEKMLVIFEACSFQDITGQRIAKVVETLQHIEERVARFATAMQAKDLDGFITETERERTERRERLLLHGPQQESQAIRQSDVDSLLTDKTAAA